MDWGLVSTHAAAAIFAVAAVSLFAVGNILATRRRAAPARIRTDKTMISLLEAASTARNAAVRESLPIAAIASRGHDAAGIEMWFAQNVATIVPIYRKIADRTFERCEPPIDVGSDSQSLYIRRQDYQTYMRWARTVQ